MEIAELVGCSEPTVTKWRAASRDRGLVGLADAPRPGRPRTVDAEVERRVLWHTLLKPPEDLGVTQVVVAAARQTRGLHFMQVAAIWRHWGIRPWREETFKFSTDSELEAKARDVVGLYLHPPEAAAVLCVDEKSQVQALECIQPMLPVRPGLAARGTHDYRRHGTTTLFAALEVATGKVVHDCRPRQRNREFLAFLRQVAMAYPRRELHLVCDNYSAHNHPNVQRWGWPATRA